MTFVVRPAPPALTQAPARTPLQTAAAPYLTARRRLKGQTRHASESDSGMHGNTGTS
ncbi:MAG: hypothetical protein K0R44_2371 [Thermomicrobiales bacterium]|nr:hypothetical protein [Thermomicrobiales bacterium]